MKDYLLILLMIFILVVTSSCRGQEITLEEALAAPIVDDRPEVMHFLGRPDAFDISIIQVEGGQVRLESWRYFDYGIRIDFVDGEAVWTLDLEPVPAGTIFPAWYDPMDFYNSLSVEDASEVIRSSSPAEADPQPIELDGAGEEYQEGLVLVGDQILLGFDGNQLVYVETIALMPEGGGS